MESFFRIADGVSVSSSMRMQLGTLLMGSCVPIVTFKRQSISTPDFAVGDSMLMGLEDCCWQIWWSPTSSTAAIRESQKCTEMILRLDFLIWGLSMMMMRMKKAGILVSHHSDDPRDDAASSCHAGTSKIKVPPCWENVSIGMCRKYSIPAKVTVKKMTKKSYEWRIPSRSSLLTQHLCTLMRWQAEKNLPTNASKSSQFFIAGMALLYLPAHKWTTEGLEYPSPSFPTIFCL